MKVCFFFHIFPPRFGGGTIQAIKLAKVLKSKGIDILFVTLTDDPSNKGFGLYEDFEVYYIFIKNLGTYLEGITPRYDKFSLIFKLFRTFFYLRNRYSIIHIQGLAYPFNCLSILARLLGKKAIAKVSMLHEADFMDCGRVTGRISRYVSMRLNKIIVISNMIHERFIEIGFSESKVLYIPNGVNINRYFPVSQEKKRDLKIQMNISEEIVAIFIGAITYRKGVDQLIAIWPAIAERHPETCLLLVGPRSDEEGVKGDRFCYEEVLKKIRKYGIENKVKFTGRVENVLEYLQLSDLFVFPSTMEGMPNVILETMACGVPAVSYRVSGIDDIITDGKNGSIIEIGDKRALKKAITEFIKDEEKRVDFSMKAREKIVEKFSFDYVSDRYIKLYNSLSE